MIKLFTTFIFDKYSNSLLEIIFLLKRVLLCFFCHHRQNNLHFDFDPQEPGRLAYQHFQFRILYGLQLYLVKYFYFVF